MRKHCLAFVFFLCFFINSAQAQVVTIPDPNFVAYLQATFPACMTGDQMDTQCPDILAATLVNVNALDIADLTGIEHFTGLVQLSAHHNQLTFLPALPSTLNWLEVSNNNLTTLPALPPNLYVLSCSANPLTSLPALPPYLNDLSCPYTNITSLPALPPYLENLNVQVCNLYSLPDFPPNLMNVWIDNNPNLACLPLLPESLTMFNATPGSLAFSGTSIVCIPNLPSGLTNVMGLPICLLEDPVDNPNNCPQMYQITGKVYDDSDNSCTYDGWENPIYGAKVYLQNALGDTTQVAFTDVEGNYGFFALTGNYTLTIETADVPYSMTCAGSENILVSFTSVSNNNDFGVQCIPGYDNGTSAIVYTGTFFPGQPGSIIILGGDIAQQLGLFCATSTGGQVEIKLEGPVEYLGPLTGALTPTSVAGNVLTYDIPDFSAISFNYSFGVLVTVDTTATIGDSLCTTVSMTPVAGDYSPVNNTKSNCGPVVNSYDPNIKEVYPVMVTPGYDDWLTYTIHFQNTGNAPAYNIKLKDTLDALVKPNTFEFLGASHPVEISLTGYNAKFAFDNIMLADSASDPLGSIGWIQYRVKPLDGLPDGTEINNECYIFFDYNTPILTNTATTYFDAPGAVGAEENNLVAELIIAPNPSAGLFYFPLPEGSEPSVIVIRDMSGRIVYNDYAATSGITEIDLSDEENGIYFLRIATGENVTTSKLVKF